ncbi:sugar phosphate isomerase/epimerase family protein [Paenibacillus endoradicis]|uniref:sugar phosphate isomerase/epimerase family protein n=1 Tax=Paenibacillus endoradicis TaxID=2972487 RepID=UPI00215900FC|nr:sugar phosphate isomerase/epimerase family protein [Paenibacillus endoradicis]MCR8657198.1 sugar phosphate isomerase/epimerase [Paenibacillus endoradicis]
MKLGISSYSLYQAFTAGEMTVPDMIDFAASIGAEHIEIVPLGFNLSQDKQLLADIKSRAQQCRVELSNYAIGANFADLDQQALEHEIERVKKEVDIAAELGIKRMRHDVASSADRSISNFLKQLPQLTYACQQIADYAQSYGITTSVENHGYFVQHSDRVQSLVEQVNRENFRTTLDIGNFLCVDEAVHSGVSNNLSFASIVHFKDFYYRQASYLGGEGWFQTSHGNWLRGAIVGHGDIDIVNVISYMKRAGYDGHVTIEFEGMEPCKQGTKLGFDYVRKLWHSL